MSTDQLVFNGINGATGGYLLPPQTPEELIDMILGEGRRREQDEEEQQHIEQLKDRHVQRTQRHLGVIEGVDPKNLAETGWGIIFAATDEKAPQIKDALGELLERRREQATQEKETRYREYIGSDGYQPGESRLRFLARHRASVSNPVDPDKAPYYLLIVGSPEQIPYRFQYELDALYAVGRIHFDTLEEYAQYARSVVQAETDSLSLSRRAAFLGVQNLDDPATNLSANRLIQPLTEKLAGDLPDWEIQPVLREKATKERLSHFLGGDETPALLLTASHGMGFPKGDSRQLPHQGALLCSDWPGPLNWQQDTPIPPDHYFSADDVSSDARMLGLLAFHFACYGAGTPDLNDFIHLRGNTPLELAEKPFIARLPQRLLGHPKGGALAVVSHVDRAWSYSFQWHDEAFRPFEQLEAFESSLRRLLKGHPIGSAMEDFNDKYAGLSVALTSELHQVIHFNAQLDVDARRELAVLWTANNDARSYVILGDPAVRLMVGDDGETEAERPTIGTVTVPAAAPEETTTPTAPEEPTASLMPEEPAAVPVDFGLFDSDAFRETRERLANSIREFSGKLGEVLEGAVGDAATLKVTTYVSDDMVPGIDDIPKTARLRAFTQIKIDGDTTVCVPERQGEIDAELWAMHIDMVQQAQAHRAEMLKTAVSAATGLLDSLKVR